MVEGESFHTASAAEKKEVIWGIRKPGQEWARDMTSRTNKESVVDKIRKVHKKQNPSADESVALEVIGGLEVIAGPESHDEDVSLGEIWDLGTGRLNFSPWGRGLRLPIPKIVECRRLEMWGCMSSHMRSSAFCSLDAAVEP